MKRSFAFAGLLMLLAFPLRAETRISAKGDAAYNAGRVTEAVKLYRQADKAGEADGTYKLGLMLLTGEGVPQNQTQAVALLRKASAQGIHAATYNLAVAYYGGDGVEQSYSAALRLFEEVAVIGSGPAAFNAAIMYRDGTGIAPNLIKAAKLFKQAAHLNIPEAFHALAEMEIEVNRVVEAAAFLILAQKAGDGDVADILSGLEKGLSLEERQRAAALASDWR